MKTIALGLLTLSLAAASSGQEPGLARGYLSHASFRETSALALRGFAPGSSGTFYVGLHNDLVEVDPTGFRTVLHRFPVGSGVGVIERFGDELFFSESTSAVLWRRDVSVGGAGQETAGFVPENTFDLVRAPGGALLSSSNPTWPAPTSRNGIWLIDFAGGNHRELIALTGPSGPLAFDAGGHLYYAQQSDLYPSPPGSVRILRFDAAVVQAAIQGGGAPLTVAAGVEVVAGLDGAYDLVFDDRDRLYWSDPQVGGVQRTLPGVTGIDPEPLLAPQQNPVATVTLQLGFQRSTTGATFDPYQPDHGGTLLVWLTDWSFRSEVTAVRPARPSLVSSPSRAPAGPVVFVAGGLPPGATTWLCGSALPPLSFENSLFQYAGTPLWSALDFSVAPVCLRINADAAGEARVTLPWSGGAAGSVHFQALGFERFPPFVPFGTSPVYTLTLLP